VSDTSQVATSGSAKRVLRPAEEKRRIVEATLVPGASIARVARENGVNANQVFQWRCEYRNGAGWAKKPRPELLAVTIASESGSVAVADVASGTPSSSNGSIHIELPDRALVSVEGSVDPELMRILLWKSACWESCDVTHLTGSSLLCHRDRDRRLMDVEPYKQMAA
jgi:transposase